VVSGHRKKIGLLINRRKKKEKQFLFWILALGGQLRRGWAFWVVYRVTTFVSGGSAGGRVMCASNEARVALV
jgi:hypothetical protein